MPVHFNIPGYVAKLVTPLLHVFVYIVRPSVRDH